MVMFPASTLHHVDQQIIDKERITLAFNIGERVDMRTDNVYP